VDQITAKFLFSTTTLAQYGLKASIYGYRPQISLSINIFYNRLGKILIEAYFLLLTRMITHTASSNVLLMEAW